MKREISRIKQEIVEKSNVPFKELSTLLQDSTSKYALFRGCLYMQTETEAVLNLLASDEGGSWKRVELTLDFAGRDIFYDKSVKHFKGTEDILKSVESVLAFMDKINIPISKVYFDFNHTTPFRKGYQCKEGDELYIMFDNLQCYSFNLCFIDAKQVAKDSLLCEGWKQPWED